AGALVLWVGPGASSLRHGSRLLVSGATRNQLGRLIALAVAVLLLLLGVMVIQSAGSTSWWPVPINHFDYLPRPVALHLYFFWESVLCSFRYSGSVGSRQPSRTVRAPGRIDVRRSNVRNNGEEQLRGRQAEQGT